MELFNKSNNEHYDNTQYIDIYFNYILLVN